jgi:predicted solute-binding protein
MLGKEGTVAVDVLAQEEEMLNRMEDLKELWAMLSSFPQNTQRVVIPLACIVIYKGLKVFCKAELFSNSLIISELKERHSFRAEI